MLNILRETEPEPSAYGVT